ncbi:universal stress protein [Rhodobacteraceae bacterium 2376]|uniref:Universal stress protein n=1 Tax=Rhabdonatronobacter sediminivivens TaxID=2743469 RepID=A0A7Z0HWN4_9RHOB|nr:universal stress protein [Rhabdonatronobacter sediminivivens]NYS23698.1 universal stress protein [Rhabdonatronobacter sediminivivens]
MERIIAATDLTRRSARVLGRAVRLARNLGAEVVFVSVLPLERGGVVRRALRPALTPEAVLDRLRAEAAGHEGVAIDCRVLEGTPEAALHALAQECGAGLIILGLHKERRVLDVLRLTTMERIVLASDLPVLIAHRPVAADYARVLGSVTFSHTCARALQVAARIAPGASIHAIHALQMPLRDKLSPTDPEQTRSMTEAEVMRSAFCAMDGVPDTLPEIIIGGVHEVLRFRIEELRPDLLALGTHSGRDPGVLGNYTRDLMRAPPCDILVVKPPV